MKIVEHPTQEDRGVMTKTKTWQVYLLWNTKTKRTYIGATTDVRRRLRQHKGEIVGGAKSTRKERPSWTLVCYLEGFLGRSTTYRWEKLLKSRCKGLEGRQAGFSLVSKGVCPEHKNWKLYQVPEGLVLK
jgi:predicted GIY-YIG superfamily endonuclease